MPSLHPAWFYSRQKRQRAPLDLGCLGGKKDAQEASEQFTRRDMAGKRKNDEPTTPELTGREKKKQKTAVARTIPVQSITASGSTAPQNTNAVAGPSRPSQSEQIGML